MQSFLHYICSLCVYNLVYPVCKAHAAYYFVKYGLSGCTVFFTLARKLQDFQKKKKVIKHKRFVDFHRKYSGYSYLTVEEKDIQHSTLILI